MCGPSVPLRDPRHTQRAAIRLDRRGAPGKSLGASARRNSDVHEAEVDALTPLLVGGDAGYCPRVPYDYRHLIPSPAIELCLPSFCCERPTA
jgi:hypothetical protein